MKLYLGNFGVEHEWAGQNPGQEFSASVQRVNTELSCCWLGIAEQEDVILTPEPVDSEFPVELRKLGLPDIRLDSDQAEISDGQLVPWGWADLAVRFVEKSRFLQKVPSLEAVVRANSRQFSFACEQEWGIGLVGAVEFSNEQEFQHCLARNSREPWVVKAEFGMSARERILGRGNQCSDSTLGWIRKRLKTGGRLYFEPWVERMCEFGIQFEISAAGVPQLLGATRLLSNAAGQYQGSRLNLRNRERSWLESSIEYGCRLADRVAQLGYFGPLGIDSMVYRTAEGETRIRPLQDVNARYTMGRMALGFKKLFPDAGGVSWLHVRWPGADKTSAEQWCMKIRDQLPAEASLYRTSPVTFGDQPTRLGTVLLIAKSAATQLASEQIILNSN